MQKKSQIWVETAIYTLIGMTVIAVILSIAVPQIEKMKDKGVIEQTIYSLGKINEKILETEQAPGNIRIIDLSIKKGKIIINSSGDSIVYILEGTRVELSEPGEEIKEGPLILKTEKYGSRFTIILTTLYNDLNLTYNGREESKTLTVSGSPYKILIENKEVSSATQKPNIDFKVI